MILDHDFSILIDADAEGIVVTVSHPKLGLVRRARLSAGETVQRVRQRLLAEVKSAFYHPGDFILSRGCGPGRTLHWAEHKPSGTTCQLDSTRHTIPRNVDEVLVDAVLERLWQAGLLVVAPLAPGESP